MIASGQLDGHADVVRWLEDYLGDTVGEVEDAPTVQGYVFHW